MAAGNQVITDLSKWLYLDTGREPGGYFKHKNSAKNTMAVILNQGVVSGIILVNLIKVTFIPAKETFSLFSSELFAKIELNCMYL